MSRPQWRAVSLIVLAAASGALVIAIFQLWLTPSMTLALLDGAFMCR
ncbi:MULTISPECIES: hypothetical protein [Pseudomonadota]|jgi:hypothetical protein|nr:hypothetical protein [Achromobacter xylosoxidans]MCH4578146.1 hypothetical protein [Achromobacter xylosoxidans]